MKPKKVCTLVCPCATCSDCRNNYYWLEKLSPMHQDTHWPFVGNQSSTPSSCNSKQPCQRELTFHSQSAHACRQCKGLSRKPQVHVWQVQARRSAASAPAGRRPAFGADATPTAANSLSERGDPKSEQSRTPRTPRIPVNIGHPVPKY